MLSFETAATGSDCEAGAAVESAVGGTTFSGAFAGLASGPTAEAEDSSACIFIENWLQMLNIRY